MRLPKNYQFQDHHDIIFDETNPELWELVKKHRVNYKHVPVGYVYKCWFSRNLYQGLFVDNIIHNRITFNWSRMLDMGFYDDIMDIAKNLPKVRQNLMFSATMPPKIRKLASNILANPTTISLSISKPAVGITQKAYMVHDKQKIALTQHLLKGRWLWTINGSGLFLDEVHRHYTFHIPFNI